ncbi:MAG: hypothetical protein E6G67_03535 [Actinobacteria bacterium]|nr:MAG: hypothetical protein E6G67_03535 [Actinomycetota bacterium]
MGFDATALAAPYFVVAALVGVGGVAKLRRPEAAVGSLAAAGIPAGRAIARLGGLAELGLAAVCFIVPGPLTAGLLAGAYATFALFLWRLLRTAPEAPCGCFGEPASQPSGLHLVVNVVAATVAGAAGATGVPSLPGMVGSLPGAGIPFFVAVAGSTYAAYLASSVLPRVLPREEPQ